jgi:hypothetical protein
MRSGVPRIRARYLHSIELASALNINRTELKPGPQEG